MSQEKPIPELTMAEVFRRFSPKWWNDALELFKKDKKGPVDENDPEFDAQKIYAHWVKSYLTKL